MKEIFHFAFCINDTYVPYICVTIKSIVENFRQQNITIHVLTDCISDKSQQRLNEAIAGGECKIDLIVYNIDNSQLQGLKNTWSTYAWYRVLLPNYLQKDIDRVLYLDADTIVSNNISELFHLDMTNNAVAGCLDPESFNTEAFLRCGYDKEKKYICSGVLMMNLNYWREYQLTNKIIEWGRKNNNIIKFPDQDTINYICQDSKIVLPLKYGVMDFFFKEERFYREPYRQQLLDCLKCPAIVHYAGQNPWKRELATAVMQDEWDKYNHMLKHPVEKIYITKGWLLFKMKVWQMLHPYNQSKRMTKSDVLSKFNETK